MILQETSRGIQTNFAYRSFQESITKKTLRIQSKIIELVYEASEHVNLHVWRFKLTSV